MNTLILRFIVVALCLVLIGVVSCRQVPTPEQRSLTVYPTKLKKAPVVRVLLADKLDRAVLSVSGHFSLEVVHLDGSARSDRDTKSVTVDIFPTAKGVKVGADEYRSAIIRPLGGSSLGFSFHGSKGPARLLMPHALKLMSRQVMVKNKVESRLRVLALPNIEEYLLGVVGSEMPASWPIEALKAQAVASRSFALYKVKTRSKKGYDVSSTVMSQVWKPLKRYHPNVLMAVNSTRGIVLTDQMGLFPAYFHSQCGGFTADAKHTFLKKDITALWGVSCPLCSESGKPVPSWRLTILKRDIANALRREKLITGGKVIKVQALDVDGRAVRTPRLVRFVEVDLEGGASVKIIANKFRMAIGPKRNEVASNCFTVAKVTDTHVTFEGRGFGHSVGMCQHGARYCAAEKRWSYEDILNRYYINNTLVRLW